MLVLAAFASCTLLALAAVTLWETLGQSAHKIVAALEGRSLITQPVLQTRPVEVRISSRRVSRPVTAQPRMRAAA
jgi:hypothetical protein